MMIDTSDISLPKYLLDIASDIQIEANFCIRHCGYEPFILPPRVAKRFKQLSFALQNKYLALLLRNLLYGIYYNHSLNNVLAVRKDKFILNTNLELDCGFDVDWDFYERLDQSNCGTGYFDSDWQVLKREPDGSLALAKDSLTLYVEYYHHSDPPIEDAKTGELISILMPNHQLQNGVYIAIGNAGNIQHDKDIGLICFNISSAGAIAVMDSLTLGLNNLEIPFNFQVLHNPNFYQRFDSGILYFERKDYLGLKNVLETVYLENQSYFEQEVPLFTKLLAPGLSIAEEPNQKFAPQESFGINRCQIVANALLDAWRQGENSPQKRVYFIYQHFKEMGISLDYPYLNPDSKDIYQMLNL